MCKLLRNFGRLTEWGNRNLVVCGVSGATYGATYGRYTDKGNRQLVVRRVSGELASSSFVFSFVPHVPSEVFECGRMCRSRQGSHGRTRSFKVNARKVHNHSGLSHLGPMGAAFRRESSPLGRAPTRNEAPDAGAPVQRPIVGCLCLPPLQRPPPGKR